MAKCLTRKHRGGLAKNGLQWSFLSIVQTQYIDVHHRHSSNSSYITHYNSTQFKISIAWYRVLPMLQGSFVAFSTQRLPESLQRPSEQRSLQPQKRRPNQSPSNSCRFSLDDQSCAHEDLLPLFLVRGGKMREWHGLRVVISLILPNIALVFRHHSNLRLVSKNVGELEQWNRNSMEQFQWVI